MTTVWNRLLAPHEDYPGVLTLRQLHDDMNRAVLAAYGWSEPDAKNELLVCLRKPNAVRAAEAAKSVRNPRNRR